MAELFKRFINICLLSGGPQDLPCSHVLFRLLAVLYMLSGLVGWSTELDLPRALLATIVDAMILLLYVYGILWGYAKSARFLQTASALLAVGLLFQLLELPPLLYLADAAPSAPPQEAAILLLLLYGWSLGIYAHIIRQALETTILVSFVLTISYVLITMSVVQFLFPDLGA